MLEQRKEYKFVLEENKISNLLLTYQKKLSVIHPDRKITSLYFDTFDLSLYHLSNLSDANKSKVRVRKYGGINKYYKEIKYSNSQGKSKSVEKLSISSFNDVKLIFHNNLHLLPTVFTSYTRSYYQFDKIRMTIDRDISFFNHEERNLSKKKILFTKSIIEFKIGEDSANVEKEFFANPVAFSKYLTAVSEVYNV